MPIHSAVPQAPSSAHSDRADPWADLRAYEQAKADGTAVDASFGDLLDVINPLQHIPVVSTIYREITGDSIQGAARIVGGGLYGGIGGLIGGLVNAIAEEATGRDLGEHVMVAVGMSEDVPVDGTTPAATVQVAKADQAATAAATSPTADDTATRVPAAATAEPGTVPQTTSSVSETQMAGEEAALAGSGTLTGLAALKAFARDTGQTAVAAHADRSAASGAMASSPAASRTAADLQRDQQASAASDRTPHATEGARTPAAPPNSFIPLGDRGTLINHRARTNPAALAAESDRLGHHRLQGDPSAVPTPATTARSVPATADDKKAATPAAAPAQPDPSAAAAHGDLAERMMRALNKYEAMHRDP